MKTKLTLLAFIITWISLAQQGINYKALIKDTNGNVLASSPINIQFIIYEGASLTTAIYQESHTVNTDSNGLIIVSIGEGITSDNFNTIDWGKDAHFLNVQINTGSGLMDMGTTEFKTVPYALNAANVKGLEAIDEGNGIGWRLVGKNPENYGNIGQRATDLSDSQVASSTHGATGTHATTFGVNTTASGIGSVASGIFTQATGNIAFASGSGSIASGDTSFAFGQSSTASGYGSIVLGISSIASGDRAIALGNAIQSIGDYAFASGNDCIASGIGATAMGFENNASGSYSLAFGRGTEASGIHSVSMGLGSEAVGNSSIATGYYATASGDFSSTFGFRSQSASLISTAIGRYNVGVGNPNSWIATDPLFEIGNGTSSSNRSNALTVYKNGQHIINSEGNYGLFISNPSNTGIYVSNAGDYGAFIVGATSGIHVESSNNDNPDLILGGNSSANNQDDGIIASDPQYSGSDIYLRSNDAVVVELDNDDNGSGSFIIRNSIDDTVFDVNENGVVRINGSIVHSSDRRLKTEITNLTYGLKEILQLNPKSYFWKNEEQQKKSLGLIAQDVQPIINEIVNIKSDETQTLGISYTELIPVLINAIKEQQEIINRQNNDMLELKAEVQTIKEFLTALNSSQN